MYFPSSGTIRNIGINTSVAAIRNSTIACPPCWTGCTTLDRDVRILMALVGGSDPAPDAGEIEALEQHGRRLLEQIVRQQAGLPVRAVQAAVFGLAVGAPVDVRGTRKIGLGFGQRAHAIAGGAVADVEIAFRRKRGDGRAEAVARGEPAIARRVGAARPPNAQLAGGTGRDQARRLFDLD